MNKKKKKKDPLKSVTFDKETDKTIKVAVFGRLKR